MEEVKLWKIGGAADDPTIVSISNAQQTKTEEMLETILVKSPALLFDGLQLVCRQVETASGPLDLLGVDEDGQLIVFELKRGTLTRDAVAQVIDYASYLAELSPPELSDFINRGSGKYGVDKIDDFAAWYEDEFAGKNIESIGIPRMVLVGLGVDDRARRMVEFLSLRNVDISLITFHGFDDPQGGSFLAKQVEVLQKQTTQPTKVSKQANLQALERRMNEAGVTEFYNHVASALRTDLNNSYEWPNKSGYGYYFQDLTESGTPSNRAYVSLVIADSPKGALLLILQERATQAAGASWPDIARAWGARVVQRKGYSEVKISSLDDWKTVEPDIKKLIAAIVRGRKLMQEQQVVSERQSLQEAGDSAGDGTKS